MTRRKPCRITTGRLPSLRLFSTLLAITQAISFRAPRNYTSKLRNIFFNVTLCKGYPEPGKPICPMPSSHGTLPGICAGTDVAALPLLWPLQNTVHVSGLRRLN